MPNETRETVYLRELLSAPDFYESKHKLALCLGRTLAASRSSPTSPGLPHLLVAGTTGSGKSVAINTMILRCSTRLKPEEAALIMVDPRCCNCPSMTASRTSSPPSSSTPIRRDRPQMAVREMEERYQKMSKIAVRNIDGYNARMREAPRGGEVITRTVQTGFNRETGEAVFEQEAMDHSRLPYLVIVVDEMADLMMVAGKDIEGAIQRLGGPDGARRRAST